MPSCSTAQIHKHRRTEIRRTFFKEKKAMLRLRSRNKQIAAFALALSIALAAFLTPAPNIGAADHGDGPGVSVDRSADLNDCYLFLDPNDNTRVVLLATVNGFIVPGEAVNFGVFDHNIRYRFELEVDGDAAPDQFLDVTFSEKINSGATQQTGTVRSTFFPTFTGLTTQPNLAATGPAPVVTNDAGTGIAFFAGLVDDPFFFDIPAFARFVASVVGGAPNPMLFNRGRDSFSGYNTLSLAFSIPTALLRSRAGLSGNTLGLSVRTARRTASFTRRPTRFAPANFVDIDREGNPAVNVALTPFARKNEYNLASTTDDAAGRFAGDIVATLRLLGTNDANIGILAGVAVARGDFLRVNVTQANSGPGGGNNAGAGFPNGRRLGDDVIDTILTIVANNARLGDNVNANDLTFRDTFPFFAPAQQPRDSGTDDNTRN
jgi:hypothetical protein